MSATMEETRSNPGPNMVVISGTGQYSTKHSGNIKLNAIVDKHGNHYRLLDGNQKGRSLILDQMEAEMAVEGLFFVEWKDGEWANVDKSKSRGQLRNKLKNWITSKTKQEQQRADSPTESVTTVTTTDSVSEQLQTMSISDPRARIITTTNNNSGPTNTITTSKMIHKREVRITDGDTIDFATKCTLPNAKARLEKLVQVIEGSPGNKAYKMLQKLAAGEDQSVRPINSAIQFFLDPNEKGNAAAYNKLRDHFGNKQQKELFIDVEDLKKTVTELVHGNYPELADYTVEQPSFLVQHGERFGQPTHSDTTAGQPGHPEEKFGIFSFSKDARGTIYYDMPADCPKVLLPDDLTVLWPGISDRLVQQIRDTPLAVDNLRDYGQLLCTTPSMRVDRGVVPQFTITICDGSHPHCAPPSLDDESMRTVLFFVLRPKGVTAGYDGDTQMSKEKLCFALYDAVLKQHQKNFYASDRRFVLNHFFKYIKESALVGARDETFDEEKWKETAFKDVYKLVKSIQKKAAAVAKHEAAVAELHRKLEAANAAIQVAEAEEQEGYDQLESLLANGVAVVLAEDYVDERG